MCKLFTGLLAATIVGAIQPVFYLCLGLMIDELGVMTSKKDYSIEALNRYCLFTLILAIIAIFAC